MGYRLRALQHYRYETNKFLLQFCIPCPVPTMYCAMLLPGLSLLHSEAALRKSLIFFVCFYLDCRERLIGSVKVNLSVLAQSSPYIADVAPAPSVSRKSFAARMSMSEAFHRDSLQHEGNGSGNGHPGAPGNSIILANHCAWFVVDKKPRKSDNPSASVLKGDGNKDNSVVRLLSSENIRMDIEDSQLRVGIKMMKNGV